jgi:hypothetical protein
MRLCLQALATLSQAQIHNLVAFFLSKMKARVFASGLNGQVQENWNRLL